MSEKKEGHIYIYGEIYNEQSDYAADWGIVSLSGVMKQVQNNKDADVLIVHIHSRGGDVNEGFAIYDYLKTCGKEINTIVEGLCASIATVPFLAGEERTMTENSEFLIHNPWGVAVGDANDMEEYLEILRGYEEKLASFYDELISLDKKSITALMEEDKLITAKEAEEFGFATEVLKTIKAVAIINNKKPKKMNTEQSTENTNILKKILNALTKNPKVDPEPKALDMTTADGKPIKIDSVDSDVHVGNTVTVDGDRPADGDVLMEDKTTLTIKDGKVEKITPPKDTTVDPPESNKEVMNLIKEQNTTIANLSKVVGETVQTMAALAENIHSDFDAESDRVFIRNLKDKESASPVADAITRRKEEADKKSGK